MPRSIIWYFTLCRLTKILSDFFNFFLIFLSKNYSVIFIINFLQISFKFFFDLPEPDVFWYPFATLSEASEMIMTSAYEY